MENRSVTFGVTGISLLVAFVALAFRGTPTVVPASSTAAEQIARRATPDTATFSSQELAVAGYDRGRRLLGEYAGGAWETLVQRSDSMARGQLAMLSVITGATPSRADSLQLAARRVRLRVSIALVPDPYDSHMDWSYDANLEALRRAFGTAGFLPQAYWLPSRSDSLTVGGSGREPRSERFVLHDVHPGVILFRSTQSSLAALHLLYLVPEIPTSGVRLLAFRAALAERAAILQQGASVFYVEARERQELAILGPNFSGSAISLRTLVDPNVQSSRRGRSPGSDTDVLPVTARSISGSATAFSNLSVLSDDVCVAVARWESDTTGTGVESVGRLRFEATVNPDEAMDEVLDSLLAKLRLAPHQVALLTESGTGYGAARPVDRPITLAESPALRRGGRDCATTELADTTDTSSSALGAPGGSRSRGADTARNFLVVPFPVNIASLRVAIDQAPAGPNPAQTLPSLGDAPRTRLSLDDAARRRESPALASKLTVPSLEVLLATLVRTMQEHGVRLVVIKATDIRDKLMLARELRRGLPDVMVVLYEGHVLMRRSEFADALRGSLVLSSYPMTMENQFWSTSHRLPGKDIAYTGLTDLLALPSDASLGVYNAAVSMLGMPERRVESTLHNAFPADSAYFLPPIWLSVIGRDGFYPVWAKVPSERWWPYLGVRDARKERPVAAAPRLHEHTYTDRDVSLTFLVVLPMGLVVALMAMFLRGRHRFSFAPYFEVPGFLARPTSARESLFLSLFLLSLVAAYLPFSIAMDARRTINSLDPLREGASAAMWMVGGLSLLVILGALALLANGWIGVLGMGRTRAGGDPPTSATPAPAAPPLVNRFSEILARMRAPTRMTGQGRAVGAPEALSDFERQTTRVEEPWMARVGMALITAASLLFVYSSLRYTWHLLELAAAGGPEAALAMFRAMHLTSGVSPLLPLVLLAVGFAIWTWWQLQQSRTLDHQDPFESGLRQLAAPEGAPAIWRRMYRAMVEARRGMGWIAPGFGVLGIMVAFLLCAWFVQRRRLPSLEVVAHASVSERSFDWALWVGLLSLLVSSAWAVYRLVHTWHSLERFLDVVAGTPVVNAFLRLPLDVVRVTDVGFLGFRRDGRGDEAYVDELWESARRLAEHSAPADGEPPSDLPTAFSQVAGGAAARWERVQRAFVALGEGWRASRARPQPGKDVPLEGDPLPTDRARTLRGLEEYVACEVLLFTERYLRNLRRLCFFLFASLLILVVVSAQYPYQPRSVVALASLLLLGATVVSVFWVMVRVSRNETLSRIARTEPGRVTWDTSFVLNVVTFGIVPLLAFASSEFPAVRTFLFSWAEPLVRAVART